MTSFFENQTLRKTLKFVNTTDDDKNVSISISLNANHEIDKNIISEIERNINSLFLVNYMKEDEFIRIKQQEKENERIRKENEKLQNKLRVQQEKQRKEYEKQHQMNLKQQQQEQKQPKQNKSSIRHLGDF
jgi:FKBP-type peptidyl-prolyl cis-trans isomerase